MFLFSIHVSPLNPNYAIIIANVLIVFALLGFLKQTQIKDNNEKQVKDAFKKLQENLKTNKK